MKLRLTKLYAAAFALAVAAGTFLISDAAVACSKYTGV